MMRRAPEAQMQRAVMQRLQFARRRGWSVWANLNAGIRSGRLGAELKRQGMLPGLGDISLLSPQGMYFELELKTERGRLSDAQVARGIEVEMCQGKYQVAYGMDEALNVLAAWGVP